MPRKQNKMIDSHNNDVAIQTRKLSAKPDKESTLAEVVVTAEDSFSAGGLNLIPDVGTETEESRSDGVKDRNSRPDSREDDNQSSVNATSFPKSHEREKTESLQGLTAQEPQVQLMKRMEERFQVMSSKFDQQVKGWEVKTSALVQEVNDVKQELKHQESYNSALVKEVKEVKQELKQELKRHESYNSALVKEVKEVKQELKRQESEFKQQVKGLEGKNLELVQEVKEVKQELKNMKDTTCEGEISKDVDREILNVYFDRYPILREIFDGETLSDLEQFLKDKAMYKKVLKSENPKGNGFTLLQLSNLNKTLNKIRRNRNELNHKRFPGHRNTSLEKVIGRLITYTPPPNKRSTKDLLNQIKERILASKTKQYSPQKSKRSD